MPANPLVRSATLFVFILSFCGAAWPQAAPPTPSSAPVPGRARTSVQFTCPPSSASPGKVIPAWTPIPDDIASASDDVQIAWACGKSQSSTGNVGQTTGSATGDALNLAANLWIAQNVKNPYTANFMQHFSQGFLTAFFKDSAERQRQQQLMNEALQRQQQEAAERARIAEQQRINAIFARLSSELKLSGVATNLSLKISGTPSELPLKLGEGNTQGAGINGLPGIYVGGPANAGSAHSQETNGLQLKLGDSSATAANSSPPKTPDAACPAPGAMGICGLPGIYLKDVQPAQAAEVASAAMNLPGPDRPLAEDAALAAAQKNPAIISPSDDPFVQDYQKEAASYADALKAQQDAWQKATEARGHAQADKEAVEYIRAQIDTVNQTEAQRQAIQQMIDAARTDEEAAAAARQMFDQADAHLSMTRDRAADALASLSTPPSNPTPESLHTATPMGANSSPALPAVPAVTSSPIVDLSHVKAAATPANLAAPPLGGKPLVENVEACVARFTGTSTTRGPGLPATLSLEELQRKLESEHIAFERIAETQKRENEDRNEWLKDMRKAAQDIAINAIDKGVDGLFDSTKEALQDADVELHEEIMEVKDEAARLRQKMAKTRQAMDAAKGDPAPLAAINADWTNLDKNQIQPLIQRRKALEAQWESTFKWQKRVDSFSSARDFAIWITDMELPCEVKDGSVTCKKIGKNNPIEQSKNLDFRNVQAEDINPSLEGLKQVLKFAAHNTDLLRHLSKAAAVVDIAAHATFIGETWDATSMTIDLIYDGSVEYLGYQRLQQVKQNDAQFEKAKAMLNDRIERTQAALDCYKSAHETR